MKGRKWRKERNGRKKRRRGRKGMNEGKECKKERGKGEQRTKKVGRIYLRYVQIKRKF